MPQLSDSSSASVAAALEDECLQPFLAELLRRPAPGDTGADDDGIVRGRDGGSHALMMRGCSAAVQSRGRSAHLRLCADHGSGARRRASAPQSPVCSNDRYAPRATMETPQRSRSSGSPWSAAMYPSRSNKRLSRASNRRATRRAGAGYVLHHALRDWGGGDDAPAVRGSASRAHRARKPRDRADRSRYRG